jgi:CRP/FNR family transcriptional regulator, cyclic AMP receptor protein
MVRTEVLSQFPIFRGLDAATLGELAQMARSRVFERAAVVMHQGDPGGALFLIHVGFLKASIESGETNATLSLMGAGESFGEIAFLDGGLRSCTVTALTHAQLFSFERQAFLHLFESQPRIGIALMEVVARRVRRLSERSHDASALPVGNRLAKQILWLAETHAYRSPPGGVRLAVQLSQKELGELVGATRESVNKHMRQWKADQLITEEDGYLVIRNVEQLRALATPPDLLAE